VAREILLEQVFPLSPIFGLGPSNYYWYTPSYPILGYYVSFNSHNNYVDIILQTGVVGLVCFFWVVGEVGLLGWRLRKRFVDDFAQGYVYACLGGLAGTLAATWLGDWLLPFVYNIGLNGFRSSILAWLFLGGLVALDHLSNGKMRALDAHSNSD
jgi:O-antigen ligase